MLAINADSSTFILDPMLSVCFCLACALSDDLVFWLSTTSGTSDDLVFWLSKISSSPSVKYPPRGFRFKESIGGGLSASPRQYA
jgi:hypothetical protein